jgi:hypothetical protein
MRALVKRVQGWIRARRERNDPVQQYLASATDLVDLEHRLRSLHYGTVRDLYTRR